MKQSLFESLYKQLMEQYGDTRDLEGMISIGFIGSHAETYGVHRYGDQEDEPAADPKKLIKRNVYYDPRKLMSLVKRYEGCQIKNVKYCVDRMSYYHSARLGIEINLLITPPHDPEDEEEFVNELEKLNKYNEKVDGDELDIYFGKCDDAYGGNKSNIIPFTSFKDVMDLWVELVGDDDVRKKEVRPGESREDYWNRKIALAQASMPRTYDGD